MPNENYEINLDQVLADCAKDIANNANMLITVAEYNVLRDVQTRFFIARRYIESCKKYSLDKDVLNMLFEIETKEGEE